MRSNISNYRVYESFSHYLVYFALCQKQFLVNSDCLVPDGNLFYNKLPVLGSEIPGGEARDGEGRDGGIQRKEGAQQVCDAIGRGVDFQYPGGCWG